MKMIGLSRASMRGAWIEIPAVGRETMYLLSRPTRGAWIAI